MEEEDDTYRYAKSLFDMKVLSPLRYLLSFLDFISMVLHIGVLPGFFAGWHEGPDLSCHVWRAGKQQFVIGYDSTLKGHALHACNKSMTTIVRAKLIVIQGRMGVSAREYGDICRSIGGQRMC